MAGPLSSANREIREAEEREHARKLARLKRPRRLTDRLLAQLEQLNLQDVTEVPDRFGPGLNELLESLSPWPQIEPRFGSRLRPGVRTSALIDAIFAIQEVLSPPTTGRDAPLDTEVLFIDIDQVPR